MIRSPSKTCFRSRQQGFSLVEVVVASGLILIFSLASLVSLQLLNRYAQISRLQTLALALAQQRIDDIMTIPWSVSGARPALLTAGTVDETPNATDPNDPTRLQLGNDDYNAATGLGSDFTGLDLKVLPTRTTTITNLTARTIRAQVTVSFTYLGRNYNVTLTSIRATDTF